MSDIQIILSGIPKSSKTQYFTVEIPPNSPVSMMLNIPYSKVTTQTTGTQTTIQKSVTQSAMIGEEEEEAAAAMGEEEAMAGEEEEAAMAGEEEAAMAGEEGAMEEEESAPVSQPSKSFSLSARPSQGQLSERQSAILSLLNSPSNSSSSSMSPSSMSSSQTPFTLSVKSSQPPKTIGQTLTQLSSQQPKQSQKPLQANPGPSMREIATNLKMAKPLVTIQRATQQNPIQQNQTQQNPIQQNQTQQNPIQQEYNFVTNRIPTNNNNGPKYSDSKIKFSMSNASLANNKQTQQIYL
jgi:hypothetical protein